MKKKCTKCLTTKPLTEFYTEKRAKDGKKSSCKECFNKATKKYADKNKDKIKKYNETYYTKNKEKLKTYRMDRYYDNRDAEIARHKQYIRDRRINDPEFRLLSNLRSGLYKSLKGLTKSNTSMQYVGCDIETLRKHIELQFTKGMNWENYGKWHLDHIKPLASFNFTGDNKESQLRDAWHFTNLQPLWAKDNIMKGSKSPNP